MTSLRKIPGWVFGGVLGTAVAAFTATYYHGIAKLRALAAELADEVLGQPPEYREYMVAADDGTPLWVEEVDPADGGAPELTVILLHGYTLDRRCWCFQRRELAQCTFPRVRQVCYDHRSHGRSGRSHRSTCTLEQLGRDLDAVIRATAAEGRIVLVGHSMGGMAIMALAELRPELFADRIAGVAFLNTSAGDFGRSGLPRPVLSRHNPVMIAAAWLAVRRPAAVERSRELGGHLIWSLIRKLSFGDEKISPAVVELMNTMMRGTTLEVMCNFLPTLSAHNRYAALTGLQFAKVLVLGSDCDRLVQFEHCQEIAELLPDAELVRVPNSGHMTMLEQPELVNKHLLDLLARCAGRRQHG
ncbi:MAG TPA: alpha/beta hydrolase [Pseudonocardiaceae bacterium]|jgi:pimeloyl-ACP methyl ester carboxylesterase|nr:alpha/beta hydrolase [Pseudonocardiaceae bacterium]